MGMEAVKSVFAYLGTRQAEGALRWDQETAHRFSRMLGSGYIKESLRSLWPDCPSEHRVALGYLITTASHWRSYLRQTPDPDPEINAGFLDIVGRLLDSLEGRASSPCWPVRFENDKLVRVEDGESAGVEKRGTELTA
jgi:hypothetical protein